MQTRKRKSATTAAVTQTFSAPLPLALNVPCVQRMQRNVIYHLSAPHIAKNHSCEFVIMWWRHFPVHSPRTIIIFWLSFLQPSTVRKHIPVTLGSLLRHLHFCFVFGPQPCNVLFIFPLLRGKTKAVYVNCMSDVYTLFCIQRTNRPTPERKIMSHLLI